MSIDNLIMNVPIQYRHDLYIMYYNKYEDYRTCVDEEYSKSFAQKYVRNYINETLYNEILYKN